MCAEKDIQEEYYKSNAGSYDTSHVHEDNSSEHNFALIFLSAVIRQMAVTSILDVGAGTGRTISAIKKLHPDIRIVGIEPVRELREQGYNKGIQPLELIDGDGNNLNFKAHEFDLVCAFGVLHHVPRPEKVIAEMLRVSNKAIFISDSNNFGQGSILSRTIKQTANFLKLWHLLVLLKTKGKGYHITEGDGLFYPYSIFNNYGQIKKSCKKIHLLNTRDGEINFYRTASHIALLGIK